VVMTINIDDIKSTRLNIYRNEALKYITMPTIFPWQQWLCKQATMLYVSCVSCLISPFHKIGTNYMGYMPHIFHIVDMCSWSHNTKN